MSETYYATGRRKTSSARIFLSLGSGQIKINKKKLQDYFKIPSNYVSVMKPFEVTQTKTKYDAFIKVSGGGSTGQAEAIRHGISKALLLVDEKLRPILKRSHLLTRDSRSVERKKYGRHKARKSTQYSKR